MRRWRTSGPLLVVALVLSAAFVHADPPRPPLWRPASELSTQPCFAHEDGCDAPPVYTSDGRIYIEIVSLFLGEAQVFVDRKHVATCDAAPGTLCAYFVDARHAGTYVVSVAMGPTTEGALLLEVLTPS